MKRSFGEPALGVLYGAVIRFRSHYRKSRDGNSASDLTGHDKPDSGDAVSMIA